MTITKMTTMTTALLLAIGLLAGCGAGQKQEEDFFTSGNREADQRADQRMAQDKQLKGEGSAKADEEKKDNQPQLPKDASLYERLGAQEGLTAIVDDFVNRAIADPRVNWDRSGVKKGGVLPWKRGDAVTWDASKPNVAQLKKHIVQFLSLATGGPSFYDGKDMKQAHAGMRTTNAEFDAAVGDLKATLDKLKVPNQEQKELLAIIESTRPQVAEER